MGQGFLGIAVGVLGGVVLLAGCLQEDQPTGLGGDDGPDPRGPEGAAAGKPSNVTINETGKVIGAIEKRWSWKVEPNATRAWLEFEIKENPDAIQDVAYEVTVVLTRPDQKAERCGNGVVVAGAFPPGGSFTMCHRSLNMTMSGDWTLSVGGSENASPSGYCICGYRMTVDVRY